MTDSRDEMDVESDDQFSANLTAPLRRSPPSTGTAIQVGDSQPTPPRKIHKDQPSIPGYEFLKRLGRGGMGVVWLCRDLRAGRVVALKQTTCDDWRDADHARFRTEAQAMARLDHPQIVKVFEVNEFEGIPYFTMEYCPGGSLQEFLDRKPQPPALAGVMVEKLARGVQHAHQNGIVHRDLKPANVLLASDFGTRGSDSKAPEPTAEGTTDAERRREAFHISVRNPHSAVLKITDFGLAKNLDTDQHLTRTEAVMGTPSYMAPEQARSAKTAGPPADVWSLGVILYEAITGSLPFVGADFVEIVENVRLQDPVRPSERVKCPRDLETICLKCLEKNPQRRYAHAGDLAEDLQAWLDGKPISARPVGPLERALRWAGRHRTLAMLYAVSLIALVALLGLGFWFSNRIGAEQAKRESDLKQADLERKNLEAKASLEREAEREKTFAAQKLARTQEYFTRLSQVRERNSSRRPGWTWANLEDLKSAAKIPMQSDPEQLRTLAAETLSAIDVRLLKSVGKGINGMSIAWHPDGKRIAVGERASGLALFCKVTLIDLETDKAQELFFQPVAITKKGKPVPDRVNDLAFSPDGRWLVAGMRSGNLFLWDLTQATPAPQSWSAHDEEADKVRFSLDGLAVYSHSTKQLRKWSLAEGRKLAEYLAPAHLHDFAVHPWDGSIVCSLSERGLISLDSENLDPLRVDSPQEPGRVAFTPDGLLVVASEAGLIVRQPTDATHVQRYRRRTGEPADAGRLDFLAVQPTGELILQSESRSESIKLWSRLDLRTVATFPVPNATREIAFSPNGRFFAVTADLETRIYEIRGCDVRSIFAPGIHFPFTFGLNRDRDEIALVDETFLSSLRLWNLDEVEPWRGGERFFGDHGDHRLLRLLPPRSDLPAVAVRKFQDTTITVHDLLNPFSKPLKIAEGESLAVARDPTGRIWMTVEDRLYLLSSDGKLAGSWRNPFAEMLSGKGGLNSLGMGNRYVVVGGRDGYMRLFETAQSTPRPTKQHRVGTSPLKSAAVLQDRWAFFGTESGELVVLNLPDGERLARVEASLERLDQLAVTEKGLIASGGRSGDLKLWHWDGSLLKLVMALPVSGSVLQLEFDSDGRRLIARIEGEAALRVWHLERLCAQLHQHGIDSGIENLLPPKGGTKSIPERLRMPRKIEPFAEGEPKGLIAELFNDPNLHTVVKVRYEDSISFNWGEGSPDPLLQHDDFSIRWSGWLKAPKPGRYQLQVHSIGGFRIWIDGKRILDQWPTFSGESPAIGVMLTGGPQSIRIEYREVRGPAKFRLNWANGDPAMPRFFPTREAACNNAEFGIRNAE